MDHPKKKTSTKKKKDNGNSIESLEKNKFTSDDKTTDELDYLYNEVLKSKDQVIAVKDALILELYNEINLLKENNNYLKEKINDFSHNKDMPKLYAEALKPNVAAATFTKAKEIIGNNMTIKNSIVEDIDSSMSNYIIINPKNKKQDNRDTRREILQHISTKELNIVKVYNLADGGIKIHCKNQQDIDKLESEVCKKLRNYEVRMNRKEKCHPKIKIVGFDEEYSQDELKKCIKKENVCITENSQMEVLVIKKMKTKYMAIIELDPTTFKKVMENGVVLVDLIPCTVYEHISLRRCFNCCGYHHFNKNCSKSAVCMACGLSDHNTVNCKTENKDKCCPNCKEANDKFGVSLFINHGPFDRSCSIFKNKLKHEQANIQYTE